MVRKALVLVMGLLLLPGVIAGCGQGKAQSPGQGASLPQQAPKTVENRVIQIKGSDTMVYLSQALAEEFMKRNPSARLAVKGGGSGTGISALIDGTAELANASRKMKDEEIDEARSKGIEPQEFEIAFDAIAIIINP
ncbi:MAG: substrate-binding domain-containing protein, partial [Clostridia bacterium]|nr:substrate-binding domain-containing protein [Clostridia bacterium]